MLIISFNLTLSGEQTALLLYNELTKTQKRDMTPHKPTIGKRRRWDLNLEPRRTFPLPYTWWGLKGSLGGRGSSRAPEGPHPGLGSSLGLSSPARPVLLQLTARLPRDQFPQDLLSKAEPRKCKHLI